MHIGNKLRIFVGGKEFCLGVENGLFVSDQRGIEGRKGIGRERQGEIQEIS